MEFKKRTETVGGVEYTLIEPEGGVALSIQEEFAEAEKSAKRSQLWADTVIATAMRIKVEDLRAMPISHYSEIKQKLWPIALDLFGLKQVEPGEAQAGASPAA